LALVRKYLIPVMAYLLAQDFSYTPLLYTLLQTRENHKIEYD
jgi:hypothetical protein